MPEGKCALCGQQAELQVSHLIPRFIAVRLKADSPNPFMRGGKNLEQRVQDSPKQPLLCRPCEQRLSIFENAFARDLFSPVMNGQTIEKIELSLEHQKFCASLAWRNLVSELQQRVARENDYSAEDWSAIENTEAALRNFLLDKTDVLDDPQFHLLGLRSVTEAEYPGINALLNLTTGFELVGRPDKPDRLYSITFMNGLLLVTLIRADKECKEEWSAGATLIVPGGRWSSYGHSMEDPYFGGILLHLAEKQVTAFDNISAKQRAVISEAFAKVDKKKWLESAHGKAVLQDFINKQRKK